MGVGDGDCRVEWRCGREGGREGGEDVEGPLAHLPPKRPPITNSHGP